jgi:hypothetical protein
MIIPPQEIQTAHKSGQKEPKLLFDAHGLVTWGFFLSYFTGLHHEYMTGMPPSLQIIKSCANTAHDQFLICYFYCFCLISCRRMPCHAIKNGWLTWEVYLNPDKYTLTV